MQEYLHKNLGSFSINWSSGESQSMHHSCAHAPVISRQGDFHKKIVCDTIGVENDQSDDERSADTAQDSLDKLNLILMYIKTRQRNFMNYNALVASVFRTCFWYWCIAMEEAVEG